MRVRDFLRKHSDFGFDEDTIAGAFGSADGNGLLETLLNGGYIGVPEAAHGCRYHLTLKGGALAGASATKPYTRKAADKALAGFVQRCHEVRERDEFVLKVGTAWLFGNMLTDKPKVGDVDIAVFLAVKAQYSENLGHVMWAKAAEAGRNGRRFSSYFERSTYVHQCVLRHLKSRSRILKLCDHNDGVLDLCEKKVIYQDPDSDPPSSISG